MIQGDTDSYTQDRREEHLLIKTAESRALRDHVFQNPLTYHPNGFQAMGHRYIDDSNLREILMFWNPSLVV